MDWNASRAAARHRHAARYDGVERMSDVDRLPVTRSPRYIVVAIR